MRKVKLEDIIKLNACSECVEFFKENYGEEAEIVHLLKTCKKYFYWVKSNLNPTEEELQETNTGDMNTGDMNTGDRNTGDKNTGDRNTGDMNTGDRNTGDMNTGYWNTGDRNTGDRNTGDMNTGDRNTGDKNTGYRNTGNRNTGDRNTGYWNTGDRNTGDMNTGGRNTGDRNTGYWNKTDYSTGFLCDQESDVLIFNKKTTLKREDAKKLLLNSLIELDIQINIWVHDLDMSDEEKIENPNFYVQEGYLKCLSKKEISEKRQEIYNKMSEEEKEKIKNLPNFDAEIFYNCTGVRV